jgi:hypothetical protein
LKEPGCYITAVLSKEPAREPPVLYWFFHENCWFIKGFEITGTNSSLILGY